MMTFSVQEVQTAAQIVEKYGKAVVLITTVKESQGTVGIGTGFIVSSSGVIITNFHVIAGAYPAMIKLTNGDIYDDILIIDFDERRDIAIIKIKGWDLPVVELGNSELIKIGEQIIVIGNPQGLENSVTDGLVSGIRDSGDGYNVHQISAPISPGSSGSPVFNRKGEVIGIATSSIEDGQNLNFSVPINYARGLISEDVKMDLEEFSKLAGTFTSQFEQARDSDIRTFLARFNDNIRKLFRAIDQLDSAFNRVFEPDANASDFDFLLTKERISNVLEEAMTLRINHTEASELLDEYLLYFRRIDEGMDNLFSSTGLKKTVNTEVLFKNVTRISVASSDIMTLLSTDFYVLVNEHFPGLKDKILPYIHLLVKLSTLPTIQLANTYMIGVDEKVIVSLIDPNSSAWKAGLRGGDIILGITNGPRFPSIIEFFQFLMNCSPGRVYEFDVQSLGMIRSIPIRLEEKTR